MPARRRCAACGRLFEALPQVPEQSYCRDPACQRERRKLWQRQRRSMDPDYQDNQARAQAEWLKRNPDYWRDYRLRHPEYTDRNRELQRQRARDDRGGSTPILEAQDLWPALTSGLFALRVISAARVAKMDVSYLVELVPVMGEPGPPPSLQREDSLGRKKPR